MSPRYFAITLIPLVLTGCLYQSTYVNAYKNAPTCPYTMVAPPCPVICCGEPTPPVIPIPDAPMTLAELINIALCNNTQTKESWATAQAAAANLAVTMSDNLPTLDGSYTYDRSFTPNFDKNQPNLAPFVGSSYLTKWGPRLSLSYTLLDFGQRRASTDAAKQALFSADWIHNREIESVIDTIATDYYNYLYQKELYQSLIEDLETAQLTYDAASLAVRTGVKDISDLLQAQTNLLSVKTQWITQQAQVEIAYAQLLKDMGLPADLAFEMQKMPDLETSLDSLESVDELIACAMKCRTDLLAAKATLLSKEAEIEFAQSQFYPTVNTQFHFGKSYFFRWNLHDKYNWESIISLNVPIFAGFKNVNSVKQAKAQKRKAEAQLLDKKLSIIQEITTSHTNVTTSHEGLRYAKEFLEAAQKQYRIALRQYKVGTTTILDVVSAQSSLADARANKAQAEQSWLTSLVDLSFAAGILCAHNPEETVL